VQLNTDTHHSMDIQFLGGIDGTSQSPDDSFTPEEHHDSFTDALSSTYQSQYFGDLHSQHLQCSGYSHFSGQLPSSNGAPFPGSDLSQVHQFSSQFRPASNQLFTTTDIRHSSSHTIRQAHHLVTSCTHPPACLKLPNSNPLLAYHPLEARMEAV